MIPCFINTGTTEIACCGVVKVTSRSEEVFGKPKAIVASVMTPSVPLRADVQLLQIVAAHVFGVFRLGSGSLPGVTTSCRGCTVR